MNADPHHMDLAAAPVGVDPLLAAPTRSGLRKLPLWARVIHWAIIANFALQMFYASWQVFVVMQLDGHVGPMWGAAQEMPFEMMLTRRLYALEGWAAAVGLSLYLGVTEILPRRRPLAR